MKVLPCKSAVGWLWIGCLLCVQLAYGAGRPDRPEYLVDAWRMEEGLPHDSVTALLQSREGYLWVGTSNGLARFDGVRFTTFRALENPELRGNRIRTLHEDSRGRLWIGIAGGGVTSYHDGQFIAHTSRQALSSEEVLCLATDRQGNLWVGTGYGLDRWDQTRFRAFFAMDGLPDDRVQALTLDPNGRLVVGTQKGLAVAWGTRFESPPGAPAGMPHGEIQALLTTRTGDLWAAGPLGLWRKRPEGAEWECRGPSATAVLEQRNGDVVFGTRTGSVHGLRLKPKPAERPAFELARFDAGIEALCEDREGNLWVGTAGQGLLRLKPAQLHLACGPEASVLPDEIISLACLPSGEVWMATSNGLLRKWGAGGLAPLEDAGYPPSAQARVLASDKTSGLWIGTQGDGLFRWHGGQLAHWDPLDGLSDSDIRAIHVGRDGGVWVGTANGGLNYLRDGQVRRFSTPWGFDGTWATVIEEDEEGRLWIGTNGDGLFRLAGDVFTPYSVSQGLPSGQVRALAATDPDELWVGTAAGLVRIQNAGVHPYTVRDGLTEDDICQLQDDGRGNLWLGCGRGIFRLPKSQLRAYAQGSSRFLDSVPYGKPDGLPPLECVPGARVENASQSGGALWFATSKGLVSVVPCELAFNPIPPPVVLEQVLVENNPVALGQTIRVPPGRESIQLRFTALSLVAPEKVRFRCQLEGFERDWVDVGTSRGMRYTKVPPGRYELRVIACNNDGVWNETGVRHTFLVQPFWWQTTWFRLAVVGAIASFGGGVICLHRLRQRELDRLRVRLAGDLHDEVGSSLWSIALLSQMLGKHGQMGQEERREVSEIHRIATQTSNAIRDIVWLINPAFDTMQDLVLRMQDFAKTVLRETEHRITWDGIDLAQRLPLEFRQHVFLMFKEAVTNVAKHAAATRVEVRLEQNTRRLYLTVQDNGAGFDLQTSTKGNGLRNLRRRAEKVGGDLDVTTAPGVGTRLCFVIPAP